jgi:glycosyltransferase involved in cell wall biosynthesis
MIFSKLTVLLISMYFPPETTGGATGAWNRAMIFHKLGYSVFILCGFPSYPTGKVVDKKYKGKYFYIEPMEHFTVIRIRLVPISHSGLVNRFILFFNFIFIAIVFMPRILKIMHKIDVTYARAPILFSTFIGFIYAKFTKSFFILEMPDLWPEELVNIKTRISSIIMKLGKLIAKLAYTLPDVIVTVSDLAALHISTEYKPKMQVYGIPTGVDPSKFPILQKNKSREELIMKNIFPSELRDKFIVLYSGLISVAQQVENLAYAAEALKNEKEIAIVIVGDGEKKKTIEQLKKEHNLENLFLIPIQPRILMPTIISSADVCAITLSSEPIFEIAIPTKFYEYLASKKPLIGVCKGELSNIINSYNIGRVANHGDIKSLASHIKEFQESPTILKSMVSNCEKALQRFSLDKIANDFNTILPNKVVISNA